MSDRVARTTQILHGLSVIRGTVANIIEHRRSRSDGQLCELRWREIEIKNRAGDDLSFIGEVVYGATHGDDVALVIDPRGREPLCLANISTGEMHLHGSVDPDPAVGDGVLGVTILVAAVAALPGLLVYYSVIMLFFPNNTDAIVASFRYYPLILVPSAWYVANRLDAMAVDRAKRVYGEAERALRTAGVTSETKPVSTGVRKSTALT